MHVCTLLRSSNVTTLTDATVLADAAEAHTRALQRNQQIVNRKIVQLVSSFVIVLE